MPRERENTRRVPGKPKKSPSPVAAEEREKEIAVLRAARTFLRGRPGVGWTQFYRYVFGPEGIVSQHYPKPKERGAFQRQPVYQKLQQMLAKLRNTEQAGPGEYTRMITVRLPSTVHRALQSEAHLLNTSVNQLCITKLLQIIDQDLVSTDDRQSRRKREEPGPRIPPPLE